MHYGVEVWHLPVRSRQQVAHAFITRSVASSQTGAFRAYGVTKAELIIWLLRKGRDVCISDVDTAWILPPTALLASVPDADVLAGTDCLSIPAGG